VLSGHQARNFISKAVSGRIVDGDGINAAKGQGLRPPPRLQTSRRPHCWPAGGRSPPQPLSGRP